MARDRLNIFVLFGPPNSLSLMAKVKKLTYRILQSSKSY
jgi:hypothetical protein